VDRQGWAHGTIARQLEAVEGQGRGVSGGWQVEKPASEPKRVGELRTGLTTRSEALLLRSPRRVVVRDCSFRARHCFGVFLRRRQLGDLICRLA
jgi:hypothetical protein